MNKIKKTASAASATAAVTACLMLAGIGGAQAAGPSGYQLDNTDPYHAISSTGRACASGAYAIGAGVVVRGSRIQVYYSPSCGTNWEVVHPSQSGAPQCIGKRIERSGQSWTKWDFDQTYLWSYSMQTYAPGNTHVTAEYSVGLPGVQCSVAWDEAVHGSLSY